MRAPTGFGPIDLEDTVLLTSAELAHLLRDEEPTIDQVDAQWTTFEDDV